MTTTYQELEQALENAYTQVQTMSAIIGWLMEYYPDVPITITAEELRHNFKTFSVIVEPKDDSITLTLKEKNAS